MEEADRKLVGVFLKAQAEEIGLTFSENILVGLKAVLRAYPPEEAERMKHFTYRYFIPDHGSTADDAFEFTSNSDYEEADVWGRWLAQEAASDYHHNHDGWEATWPLDFVLLHEDKVIGRFTVERDHEPVFYAEACKEKATTAASLSNSTKE